MAESKDIVILQLKIEEAGGKKLQEVTKETEVLASSIVGLAKANKELRAERGKLDTSTDEGIKKIKELNAIIDKNNETIKQNSSNLEKQRLNVGNYKRGVIDALKELRIGGVNVGDVVDKLSKANEDLFQGMIQGYQKSGIAAKLFGTTARTALTLTGIGIIIAGLATMVAYWDDIKVAIGLADSEQKKFLDNARKELEDQNTLLERRIQLLELWGASQKAINDLTIPNLKEEIRLNEIRIQQIDDEIKKKKLRKGIFANLEDLTKEQEDLKKHNEEILAQITLLNSKAQKEQKDNNDKTSEERNKAAEAEAKAVEDSRNKAIEALRKQNEDLLKDTIDTNTQVTTSDKSVMDQRIANAELTAEQLADIRAQQKADIAKDAADERLIQLEGAKAVTDARIALATTLANTLGQLSGKNKALAIVAVLVEKAAAIAQIISNTAIANAKAMAASPLTLGMPWVAINTGTAIAAGIGVAAQAAQSVQEIGGFAKGGKVEKRGTFDGPSHALGGIDYIRSDGKHRINVEGGENFYVLKKSASAEANYLSMLNQAHGGRSFGQKTWYAAQGGQIETREIAGRSNNIERTVRSVMANLPPIVVHVQDIRDGVNRAVSVENSSAPIN